MQFTWPMAVYVVLFSDRACLVQHGPICYVPIVGVNFTRHSKQSVRHTLSVNQHQDQELFELVIYDRFHSFATSSRRSQSSN